MTVALTRPGRRHPRRAARRAYGASDIAAHAIWLAAYIAVLAIILAPQGSFLTTGSAGVSLSDP